MHFLTAREFMWWREHVKSVSKGIVKLFPIYFAKVSLRFKFIAWWGYVDD